jgi:hypothetical protein
MDNLDSVAAVLRDYFLHNPEGALRKRDVPAIAGIAMRSVHPVLQLMCGGPSSPYEHGSRAEALRGILDRYSGSSKTGTTYSLSSKGRAWLGLPARENTSRARVPLVDAASLADVLRGLDGRTFSSLDFVREFERHRPNDFAALVDSFGRGGVGSGSHYAATSHLARSLGRYARNWHAQSGLPPLTQEGWVTVPQGQAHGNVALWVCGDCDGDVVDDLQAIAQDASLSVTEREQLSMARVGQGRFRAQVLEHWNHTCPVTLCDDARMLVASHIKRWCDSDDLARLDPFNGLALTPNVDRLFDRHFISFDEAGALIRSARADDELLHQLSIPRDVVLRLDPRHRPYLLAHTERMRMLDGLVQESDNVELGSVEDTLWEVASVIGRE